jgi:hypothetical protein
MWIVAAAVGVVALIAGVKHFSASPDEDAAPPRLAQREAKTEQGGWSVRANSQDIPTGDDIKVQRQVEAKPAGSAPPRRGVPAEPQGGQPAVGSGAAGVPAQGNGGVGAGSAPHTTNVGRPPGGTNAGSAGQRNTGVAEGSPPVADLAADATGEVGGASANPAAAAPAGGGAPNGAANPAANAPPGSNPAQPAQDQQVQATPPGADVVAVGALYDSKDNTFSIDTPPEPVKVGDIPGHGVTMMMNLAPDWTPDNQDDASFLKLGDNLELSKNVNYMRLEYTDPSGAKHSIGTNMAQWEGIDPPYTVGATVNENQMALVVNGKAVARGTWEGAPYEAPQNPTLQIGCADFPDSRPCASGSASGVMVLPPTSTADLIKRTNPANTKP